jgi:3-dehydrotetronate 4-kinase
MTALMSQNHLQASSSKVEMGAKPLVFGAIADDLTGGAELASMLVARGVKVRFSIGPPGAVGNGHDAHVIALKTRVIPAEDAVARVMTAAETLLDEGARQIFFKYCATFDSTPAGNIGPCAEALMDRLNIRQTLFCPALCETNRTVYQGHMFGGAQLLGESPKRFDPLTPMTDSNLVRVLQAQSRRTAGLVSYEAVDGGVEAVRAACERLERKGVGLLLVDALCERHLATIAAAAERSPLLTGNSSIAAHLPPLWFQRGAIEAEGPITLPGVDGPGAILVGSVASQTLAQLSRFAHRNPVFTLDLARAFADDDVIGDTIAFARRSIADGSPFAISTAAPQADVEALQARFGRAATAARAEALLSAVAKQIVFDLGVRRLIVAGGETSGAVASALGFTELSIGPYEGPGLNRAFASSPARLALMFKSGKLGDEHIFKRALNAMTRPLSAPPATEWPPARPRPETE